MEGRQNIIIDGKSYPLFNMTPHQFVLYTYPGDNHNASFCAPSDGTIRLTRMESSKEAQITFFHKRTAKYNQPWNGYVMEGVRYENDLIGAALIVSMPVAEYICQNKLLEDCAIIIPNSGPKSVVRDFSGVKCGVREVIIYRK